MYNLYILKCSDGTLYTGITTNLRRRVGEHGHSALGAKYTSSRRPVVIVYSQEYANRSSASKAEAKMKKLSRLAKLELIKKAKITKTT